MSYRYGLRTLANQYVHYEHSGSSSCSASGVSSSNCCDIMLSSSSAFGCLCISLLNVCNLLLNVLLFIVVEIER